MMILGDLTEKERERERERLDREIPHTYKIAHEHAGNGQVRRVMAKLQSSSIECERMRQEDRQSDWGKGRVEYDRIRQHNRSAMLSIGDYRRVQRELVTSRKQWQQAS